MFIYCDSSNLCVIKILPIMVFRIKNSVFDLTILIINSNFRISAVNYNQLRFIVGHLVV